MAEGTPRHSCGNPRHPSSIWQVPIKLWHEQDMFHHVANFRHERLRHHWHGIVKREDSILVIRICLWSQVRYFGCKGPIKRMVNLFETFASQSQSYFCLNFTQSHGTRNFTLSHCTNIMSLIRVFTELSVSLALAR